MTSCPPIRLVLLTPKGSAYAAEDPNAGTTMLSVAMAKYRMAAYLWQAYIAEAMNHETGIRRTFQLENEWKESTLFSHDFLTNEMRSEAPVHAVVLDKNREEIRAASHADILASIETALSNNFSIPKGQKSYFACMLLDSADEHAPGFTYAGPGKLTGERLNLAVYHDASLPAYPSSIDRVTAAFSDESPAPPHSPDPTAWRSASRAIGAHLREVARMLGLPDQASGLASDECVRLAAAFSSHAAARLLLPPLRAPLRLHPLDALRLRHHPTLRSPLGPPERPARAGTAPALWAVGDGALFVGSAAGVVAVEVYGPGELVCRRWMAVADRHGMPRFTVQVSLADILKLTSSPPAAAGSGAAARPSSRLSMRAGPYTLRILTADGVTTPVVDFESVVRKLTAPALPGFSSKRRAYKSGPAGTPAPGSHLHTAIFPPSKRMIGVVVYHDPGTRVAGVEFLFEGEENLLVGSRDGEASKEWALRITDGEMLMGIEARVDGQVRGLRLFTSTGRASPWFGGAEGGIE